MIATDIEVVKATFAAFAARDLEAVLALAAPDIEFTAVTGEQAGRTEPYRGHDGMREYFRDVASRVGGAAPHAARVPRVRRPDPRDRQGLGALAQPDRDRLDRLDLASAGRKVVYVRVYASAADATAAFERRARPLVLGRPRLTSSRGICRASGTRSTQTAPA